MMTNAEKAVTWGLLALIAWELWQPRGMAAGGATAQGTETPPWVRQLSAGIYNVDFYTQNRGIWGLCK